MDQMITLTTNMQFSMERLEEIFSATKTKELFEKFITQEDNEKKNKELATKFETLLSAGLIESDMTSIGTIKYRLKVYILARSIGRVVNGKSLNQAVQAEIRAQLKEAVAFVKLEEDIIGLELCSMLGNVLMEMLS